MDSEYRCDAASPENPGRSRSGRCIRTRLQRHDYRFHRSVRRRLSWVLRLARLDPPAGHPLATVIRKGRLQPGHMFLVDTAAGRIIEDGCWEKCTLFDINYRPEGMTIDELDRGFKNLVSRLYSDDFTNWRRTNFRRQFRSAHRSRHSDVSGGAFAVA